mmetsp:Transcript_23494/g.68665  ORF Transcript_23494/g.68665 Transcript_23494/m.68665 type:complete len:225 (+) Transcript_23494:400-1074(+)
MRRIPSLRGRLALRSFSDAANAEHSPSCSPFTLTSTSRGATPCFMRSLLKIAWMTGRWDTVIRFNPSFLPEGTMAWRRKCSGNERGPSEARPPSSMARVMLMEPSTKERRSGRGKALSARTSSDTVMAHFEISAPLMAVSTSPTLGAVKMGRTPRTVGTPEERLKVSPRLRDMKSTLKPRRVSRAASLPASLPVTRWNRMTTGRFLSASSRWTKESTSRFLDTS